MKIISSLFYLLLLTAAAGLSAQTTPSPDAELAEARSSVPRLKPAAAYTPGKSGIIDVDVSEYAGYAGLIVANGGLEPSEKSYFYLQHGFKVRITLTEADTWSALNSGRIAATATTADVLPLYGQQLQAVVPLLIGFSRGADALIVNSGIGSLNDLRGKTVATAQFNEADFMLRFLTQQSGLEVHVLPSVSAVRDPAKVNLLITGDSFGSGDFYLRELLAGRTRAEGCVTWGPKSGEVLQKAGDRARLLISNRNLLMIADILMFNKAFAEANPALVKGLIEGILEGNRRVRSRPAEYDEVIAKAFGWKPSEVSDELANVHLANLPENLSFFSAEMDAAGSYSYIYEMALQAYGSSIVPRPVPAERFVSLDALKAVQASGIFAGDKAEIKPLQTQQTNLETPTLVRDIRFLFLANSATLDLDNPQNREDLRYLANMLRISPGSTLLLRGHVDNARVPEFRKLGGEALVQSMGINAVKLSKQRCEAVSQALTQLHQVDAGRIESLGLGWREPLGGDSEKNRRVEAQWFTIE